MTDVVQAINAKMSAKVNNVYYPIGCAISSIFNFSNDLIGKTDVNSGLFKKYRVRISDCTASINGVLKLKNNTVLSSFYFLEEGVRRSEVDYLFEWTADDGTYKNLEMTAIVKSYTDTANAGDFDTFDLQLQGTGNISFSDLALPPRTDTPKPTLISDYWTTTPGVNYVELLSVVHHYSLLDGVIIEVDRDGIQYDVITSGVPVGRQCKLDTSLERLVFPSKFPANVTVWVIMQKP